MDSKPSSTSGEPSDNNGGTLMRLQRRPQPVAWSGMIRGTPGAAGAASRRRPVWDLALAVGIATFVPLVAFEWEGGSPPRVALAAVALLWAPGYLLLQAMDPHASTGKRWRHAAFAVGLSPALVGLAALASLALPGGFVARNLAGMQVGLALLLGIAAWVRRRAASTTAPIAMHPPGFGTDVDGHPLTRR